MFVILFSSNYTNVQTKRAIAIQSYNTNTQITMRSKSVKHYIIILLTIIKACTIRLQH